MHAHTHTHTCTHAYIYAHTNTHTHTWGSDECWKHGGYIPLADELIRQKILSYKKVRGNYFRKIVSALVPFAHKLTIGLTFENFLPAPIPYCPEMAQAGHDSNDVRGWV